MKYNTELQVKINAIIKKHFDNFHQNQLIELENLQDNIRQEISETIYKPQEPLPFTSEKYTKNWSFFS
jgi:hypothetical protein